MGRTKMMKFLKVMAVAGCVWAVGWVAEARSPFGQDGCPPTAWCHPDGQGPGDLPIGSLGFMSDSDIDAVGNALSEYKCTLLDPGTCLAKLLDAVQCYGPQGEVRQQLCDLRDKSDGGGSDSRNTAQVFQLDDGRIVSGLRSAKLKNAFYRSLLEKKDWADDPRVICDERGRCYCPVDAAKQHPRVKKDFALACGKTRSTAPYMIVSQGDWIFVVMEGRRR